MTSGYVVGIVPNETDIASIPFWFDGPDVPDMVDTGKIRESNSRAIAAGISPFPAEKVRRALWAGGEPLVVAHRGKLMQHVAPLVPKYSRNR